MNIITLILIVFSYMKISNFHNELNKFYSLKPPKENTKEKKVTVYDNASEIYNEYLPIHGSFR